MTIVLIGRYELLASGVRMPREVLHKADVVVSLVQESPDGWTPDTQREVFYVPDFGVPDFEKWRAWLTAVILPMLASNKQLAVHCTAGIGRTGMFLASLIALLEPADVVDPVMAVRKRYRANAVETAAQYQLVLALRDYALRTNDLNNYREGVVVSDDWKQMSGTTGSGEYIVLARLHDGDRVGIRPLGDGTVRIRVEPSDENLKDLLEGLTREAGWKQPGDDGQNRFSIVKHGESGTQTVLDVLKIMAGIGQLRRNSARKAHLWRSTFATA